MTAAQLVVEAAYHQFFLAAFETSPVWDGKDAGPLVAVVDDARALIVSTGCTDGPVRVVVTLHTTAPAEDDPGDAEESASMLIVEPLCLTGPTTGFALDAEGKPWSLTPVWPGPHRVRVRARNRGADHMEYHSGAPVESFLVDVWPEPRRRARETVRDDGFGIGC